MNYFQFCAENSLSWAAADGYVRFRLRAILDKRRKAGRRARRGRGYAHRRWPNRYFAELGLFSLQGAPKLVLQP
jgi:RNA-directed DNA polymerase